MSGSGGSARGGDERHVKVPGFWRSINLPIRPEITWADLTLPGCLCPKRKEGWEDRQCESLKMKLDKYETFLKGLLSGFSFLIYSQYLF